MRAHIGDRIVVESERVAQPPRTGVVEEVIADEPPRLRVRWDNGHTTVLVGAGIVAFWRNRDKDSRCMPALSYEVSLFRGERSGRDVVVRWCGPRF